MTNNDSELLPPFIEAVMSYLLEHGAKVRSFSLNVHVKMDMEQGKAKKKVFRF